MAGYVDDTAQGAAMGTMFAPGIGTAIGGGLGLAKGFLDAQNEKKDRQVQAAIARYSPWTGMKPESVKRADFLGGAMQGAATGAAMGQNINNMQSQQAYTDALTKQMSQPTAGQAPVASAGTNLPPGAQVPGTWNYMRGGRQLSY